jgi:hypothetical protein
MLAKEITTRFHSAAAADAATTTSSAGPPAACPTRSRSGAVGGAPLAIGALLKQAGLVPSTSEALRLVEQGGVRIDGSGGQSDKGLKLPPGTFVVQVGKRKFARVTLARLNAIPAITAHDPGLMQVSSYLKLSVAVALATIALKTGAWWVSGSVSLLSDALESLVNLAGAMFALAMVTMAARRPTTTTPTATTRPSTSPAASKAC